MTRKGLGLIVAVVIGVAIGLAVATFTDVGTLWQPDDAATDEPQTNQGTAMPEWSDYEDKIQRPLFDLATAEDPNAFADAQDLEATRMARVVIRLADDADELPPGYTVIVEAEATTGIQAWVPLDQLLDLAQESAIGYIRPPQEPTPH